MSLFVPSLISLFFFSGFVVAGIYAPDCSTTWRWSFNSLGQNACTVAAYMFSTCHAGSFTVQALPTGYHYSGPFVVQGTDLCLCNTIAYSLLSACDGCQGSEWITWAEYEANCTKTLPPGTFPNPIPAGTSLQRWALLDVTIENTWDVANAEAVGDSPELGPGTIPGPGGPSFFSSIGPSTTFTPPSSPGFPPPQVTIPSTTTTSSLSYTAGNSSSTTTPNPPPAGYSVGGQSSHAGAIAGGTVAGVVVISIAVVGLFYRQRQRSQAQSIPAGDGQGGALIQDPSRPTSGQETISSTFPGTSSSLLRPYNPEDPTTFPGYQAPPNPSFSSAQPPSLSNIKHLYTVATPPGPESRGSGG